MSRHTIRVPTFKVVDLPPTTPIWWLGGRGWGCETPTMSTDLHNSDYSDSIKLCAKTRLTTLRLSKVKIYGVWGSEFMGHPV